MANFSDPPGRRLAYDADGTVVTKYVVSSGAITELSAANKQAMNNESTDTYDVTAAGSTSVHLGLYFPGLRDITDLFFSSGGDGFYGAGSVSGIDYSTDSTNPLDGTWTNIGYSQDSGGLVVPQYRTSWSAYVASGVKALRVKFSFSSPSTDHRFVYALNAYGTRSSSDTSRQVGLVTSGGVRFTKDFDFQDRPRGSTYKWKSGTLYNQTSELYVKNFSATETANTVVVGQEALSGNMHNNIRISLDDSTYSQTLTAATIAPGASYGPIFVRWTPPSNDTLGVQTMRIPVTVSSWT